MPGTVPAGDETVLHALPEDQPDSLSKGHKSKQADIDATPAEKAGRSARTSDVESSSEPVKKSAPRKSAKK